MTIKAVVFFLLFYMFPQRDCLAGEVNLNAPKDAFVDFMMLPVKERLDILRDIARSGDARIGDFFAEVLASEDEELLKEEETIERFILPILSVTANPSHLSLATKAASGGQLLQRYAARWLGYTGTSKAVTPLKELIKSKNDFVRGAAIAGLRSLGTEEAVAVLEAFTAKAAVEQEKGKAAKAIEHLKFNFKRRSNITAPYAVNLSTVTHHFPCAKPLAKKPRVLFLLERAVLRDFVEIVQRMDVDWDFTDVPCKIIGKAHADISLLELRDDIREIVLDRLDSDWDAIVVQSSLIPGRYESGGVTKNKMGHSGWPSFPEEVQRHILKKVINGTGLVLVNQGPKNIAGRKVEPSAECGYLPWPKEVVLEEFGKGRIARFSRGVQARTWGHVLRDIRKLYPLGDAFQVPSIPGETRLVYPGEDFYFAAFCRTILWACRRDSPFRFKSVVLKARAGQPGKVEIGLEGKLPKQGKLSVEIVDPYMRVLTRLSQPLTARPSPISVPPLPGGGVVVRCKALDQQGIVLDWSLNISNIEKGSFISKVEVSRYPVLPTEPLRPTVTLTGKVPGDTKLVVEAIDNWERMVGRVEERTDGRLTIPLQINNQRLLSKVVTLHTRLESLEGATLSYLRQPVVILLPNDDKDVAWLNWGADSYLEVWKDLHPTVVSHLSLETLEAGIDCATPGFSGPIPGHDPGPYSPDGIRRPCLTSAKWELQVENSIRKKLHKYKALNCRFYLLSDETSIGGDYCFSDTCLDAFRDYLRDEYQSLDALNSSWATNLKTWAEIVPIRRTELKDSNHPGPWLDHAICQDRIYTGMYDRVQTLMRSHIPGARAGSSTTGTTDQWLFARRQGLAGLFVSIRYRYEEMSFRPDDQLLGGWFHPGYGYKYLKDEAGTHYWGWDQILHGASAIFTWIGQFGFSYPMMRGDVTADEILLNAARMVEDIRGGYGRLLLGAKRRAGDYAMYYSPRSNMMDEVIARLGKPWQVKRTSRWTPPYDADQMFRFPRVVADSEVMMGYLKKQPPKILYLPLTRCLSNREIDEIKRYVREGGILLADSDSGIRDEHGVPRNEWSLGEIFGLKRKKGAAPDVAKWGPLPVRSVGKVSGLDFSDLEIQIVPKPKGAGQLPVVAGRDVEPAGAQPLFSVAGVPAGFVHSYGKGLALYFNFDPCRLRFVPQDENEPNPHQIILDRIFKARNIRRGYKIKWDTGRPIMVGRPAFHLAEFMDSTGRYLGFIRSGQGRLSEQPMEKVELTLDEPAFVYQARDARLLGSGKEFDLTFPRGIAHFFSLLPYKVNSVEVTATTAARGGKAKVQAKLNVEGTQPRRHVLAMRTYQPNGKEARWFRQNVDASNGSFELELPIALNAATGEWKVSVRDVATGIKGDTVIRIK